MKIYYYSLPFIYVSLNHKHNPVITFIEFSRNDKTFLKTDKDYLNYFSRINHFKKYIIDQCKMSLEGLKNDFSPPKTTIIYYSTNC